MYTEFQSNWEATKRARTSEVNHKLLSKIEEYKNYWKSLKQGKMVKKTQLKIDTKSVKFASGSQKFFRTINSLDNWKKCLWLKQLELKRYQKIPLA